VIGERSGLSKRGVVSDGGNFSERFAGDFGNGVGNPTNTPPISSALLIGSIACEIVTADDECAQPASKTPIASGLSKNHFGLKNSICHSSSRLFESAIYIACSKVAMAAIDFVDTPCAHGPESAVLGTAIEITDV
jgi:hypothetical protein